MDCPFWQFPSLTPLRQVTQGAIFSSSREIIRRSDRSSLDGCPTTRRPRARLPTSNRSRVRHSCSLSPVGSRRSVLRENCCWGSIRKTWRQTECLARRRRNSQSLKPPASKIAKIPAVGPLVEVAQELPKLVPPRAKLLAEDDLPVVIPHAHGQSLAMLFNSPIRSKSLLDHWKRLTWTIHADTP